MSKFPPRVPIAFVDENGSLLPFVKIIALNGDCSVTDTVFRHENGGTMILELRPADVIRFNEEASWVAP